MRGTPTARSRSPTRCVGTDSHTTMINGLGVLGWGVGGIEAEAAMLGQPSRCSTRRVVGFKLTGALPDGRDRDRPGADRHADAAQARRGRQVRRVLRRRPLGAERCPTARRSRTWRPSTARPSASSRSTTRRCATSRRPAAASVVAAGRALLQGAGPVPRRDGDADAGVHRARSSSTSATVEPALAGPRRPQDRVPLRRASARASTDVYGEPRRAASVARSTLDDRQRRRASSSRDGAVVIAAITSLHQHRRTRR